MTVNCISVEYLICCDIGISFLNYNRDFIIGEREGFKIGAGLSQPLSLLESFKKAILLPEIF
jgi:hypothetical protein